MNFRRLSSTEGGSVGYSTSTVCHGFQNPVHQRPSSVVFNGEWILLSEPNRARMVPKTSKVGNQTEVGETVNHQVPGTVSAWRDEANKFRARHGQVASRNLDDGSYFNGSSVPPPSAPPSYGRTSQKIDYGFKPIGNNSTSATLHKESIGVTQSEPVVTSPNKNLEVGSDVDVRLQGDGKPKPLVSGKSSGKASNVNPVTISKLEKSNEPSKVRANLRRIYDKVVVVDTVPAARNVVAKLVDQYRNLVHSCDTEVCFILPF